MRRTLSRRTLWRTRCSSPSLPWLVFAPQRPCTSASSLAGPCCSLSSTRLHPKLRLRGSSSAYVPQAATSGQHEGHWPMTNVCRAPVSTAPSPSPSPVNNSPLTSSHSLSPATTSSSARSGWRPPLGRSCGTSARLPCPSGTGITGFAGQAWLGQRDRSCEHAAWRTCCQPYWRSSQPSSPSPAACPRRAPGTTASTSCLPQRRA